MKHIYFQTKFKITVSHVTMVVYPHDRVSACMWQCTYGNVPIHQDCTTSSEGHEKVNLLLSPLSPSNPEMPSNRS
jgi:hypothetical protein